MINKSSCRHFPLLTGTAIFALVWTVARASVQSLSIDEADTYLAFVRPDGPQYWRGNANNHVLNSMLMWLVTAVFGPSPITLRAPALLGAALYIAAAYCLVRLLSQRRLLQWALFVCFTCCPFVMDYLVAGRGYSLASAFLLGMVVIGARYQALDAESQKAELPRTCVLISVSAALCLSANFSFAVADALMALGLFVWIARDRRQDLGRMLAWFVLPGLATAYFFVGSVLLSWPKGQFTWGADSWFTTIRSLVRAALFEPNHYLLNPRLHHYFVHFGTFLYPLLAALVIWRAAVMVLERRRCDVVMLFAAVLVAALLMHEVLFAVWGILLPLDRTALWVFQLFFCLAGGLAATALSSKAGQISVKALIASLTLIACYNIACLRLTYFNEWKYDADLKNVYSVLAYYNHASGITKVSSNWRYVGVLNCYRIMSGKETLEQIPPAPTEADFYPPGYQAYVVFHSTDEDFEKRENLRIVYHDPATDVAVAIRPEALAK